MNVEGVQHRGQGDVVAIEWTVHVANRKASFFQFHGPGGENGDFSKNGARNADVIGSDARSQLEIDPGPKSISGQSAGPVVIANSNSLTNQTITRSAEFTVKEPAAPAMKSAANSKPGR